MRTKFASALSLGAVLILLGACSQSSDQPANSAENSPPPAEETAPAAPDRSVQSGRAGAAPRAAAPTAPAPSRYACTGTKNTLSVTHSADGATARISFGTTTVAGKRAGAGHFTAAKTDLVEKGNAATLTWQGKKYSCKAK